MRTQQLHEKTTTQSDFGHDAWGRNKVIHDVSLLHGMFTYSIPSVVWYEMLDDVEQTTITHSVSTDGKLVITSNNLNQKVQLRTFRNPRYEPNRGQLYSTSVILPNSTNAGQRSWGVFTKENGTGFRLKSDGNLYAWRRTTVNSVTTDIEEVISIPSNIDIEKGNIYDIQHQWRGVGDYFFYINGQLVHTFNLMGTLTELSISNPAIPIAWECIDQGDAVAIHAGCVDVTSEGGIGNGKIYGAIVATDVALSGTSQPALIVRNKDLVNSLINTRDVEALTAVFSSDTRCTAEVWATRDDTAITLNGDTFTNYGEGHLEYLIPTNATFDTAKAVQTYAAKTPANSTVETSAVYQGVSEIIQTPGDILIFSFTATPNIAASVTYEFAEAI